MYTKYITQKHIIKNVSFTLGETHRYYAIDCLLNSLVFQGLMDLHFGLKIEPKLENQSFKQGGGFSSI